MKHQTLTPGMIDHRIILLNNYRQQIVELINQGIPDGNEEDARYWLKKVCDLGCEIKLERETSVRLLEDILKSIKTQLAELRTLYADSSFYV
jgi:hypothetical protein